MVQKGFLELTKWCNSLKRPRVKLCSTNFMPMFNYSLAYCACHDGHSGKEDFLSLDLGLTNHLALSCPSTYDCVLQ